MTPSLKTRLAIGGACVAAVAGGGIAYAAGGSSTSTTPTSTTRTAERDAYLNDVASRLKVSRSDLDAALKGARDAQLDQAVKDGKLTQAQADAIKAHKDDGAGGPGFGHGGRPGPGGPGGHMGGIGPFGNELSAAATYLGVTQDALVKQLQDGKSLADVAKAQSKDVDGLKKALLDAATKDLSTHIDDIINGKLPTPPAGAPMGNGGNRRGFGPQRGAYYG